MDQRAVHADEHAAGTQRDARLVLGLLLAERAALASLRPGMAPPLLRPWTASDRRPLAAVRLRRRARDRRGRRSQARDRLRGRARSRLLDLAPVRQRGLA